MKVGLRFVIFLLYFVLNQVIYINARLELIEPQQCSTYSGSGHHIANEAKNILTTGNVFIYLFNITQIESCLGLCVCLMLPCWICVGHGQAPPTGCETLLDQCKLCALRLETSSKILYDLYKVC